MENVYCYNLDYDNKKEDMRTKCFNSGGNVDSCNFINAIQPYCNYEPCQNSPTKKIFQNNEPCNPITIQNCDIDVDFLGELGGDINIKCEFGNDNVIGNEDIDEDIDNTKTSEPISQSLLISIIIIFIIILITIFLIIYMY